MTYDDEETYVVDEGLRVECHRFGAFVAVLARLYDGRTDEQTDQQRKKSKRRG